ncbi:MAG TPA: ABC transporter substrate-binding protein [Casimicrobiaceae bacterium]|nr:ABC transporter substrate-binding protein [Casimicrobiaceae bacterium]
MAQQAKIHRVGYLFSGSTIARNVEAFRDGLRESRWVDGDNIRVDYRFADGNFERLPVLAAELLRLGLSVLVAGPTPAALAAKHATATVPIVMWGVADPVAVGLVANPARPGGNVTGLTFAFGMELYSKELQLLKEVVATARRVAVLSNAANPGHAAALKAISDASQPLSLSLSIVRVRAPGEFDAAFLAMTKERVEGVLVVPDSVFGLHATRLATLAAKHRLPTMFGIRGNVEAGGLLSYGPNITHQHRQAAKYVARILGGATPAELPVEQPTKFELVINLRTARMLGLTLPQALLLRADELIE